MDILAGEVIRREGSSKKGSWRRVSGIADRSSISIAQKLAFDWLHSLIVLKQNFRLRTAQYRVGI